MFLVRRLGLSYILSIAACLHPSLSSALGFAASFATTTTSWRWKKLKRYTVGRRGCQEDQHGMSDGEVIFETLCRQVCAGNVHLASFGKVRGVAASAPIPKGSNILEIPLSSCILANDDYESSLAVVLLQKLRHCKNRDDSMISLWANLLPTPQDFRACLPVHWKNLEHSVSFQFDCAVAVARAQRAEDLETVRAMLPDASVDEIHYTLDLVQTRACRVDNERLLPIIAPVFDFINHGGSTANAYYMIEKMNALVIRASRRMAKGEQVLIDYGHSTRPSWQCLLNYGFVSKDKDSAEIEMGDRRFQLSPTWVSYDLVVYLTETFGDPQAGDAPPFTPELALLLADEVKKAAERFNDNSKSSQSRQHVLLSELRRAQRQVLLGYVFAIERHAQTLWKSWKANDLTRINNEIVYRIVQYC